MKNKIKRFYSNKYINFLNKNFFYVDEKLIYNSKVIFKNKSKRPFYLNTVLLNKVAIEQFIKLYNLLETKNKKRFTLFSKNSFYLIFTVLKKKLLLKSGRNILNYINNSLWKRIFRGKNVNFIKKSSFFKRKRLKILKFRKRLGSRFLFKVFLKKVLKNNLISEKVKKKYKFDIRRLSIYTNKKFRYKKFTDFSNFFKKTLLFFKKSKQVKRQFVKRFKIYKKIKKILMKKKRRKKFGKKSKKLLYRFNKHQKFKKIKRLKLSFESSIFLNFVKKFIINKHKFNKLFQYNKMYQNIKISIRKKNFFINYSYTHINKQKNIYVKRNTDKIFRILRIIKIKHYRFKNCEVLKHKLKTLYFKNIIKFIKNKNIKVIFKSIKYKYYKRLFYYLKQKIKKFMLSGMSWLFIVKKLKYFFNVFIKNFKKSKQFVLKSKKFKSNFKNFSIFLWKYKIKPIFKNHILKKEKNSKTFEKIKKEVIIKEKLKKTFSDKIYNFKNKKNIKKIVLYRFLVSKEILSLDLCWIKYFSNKIFSKFIYNGKKSVSINLYIYFCIYFKKRFALRSNIDDSYLSVYMLQIFKKVTPMFNYQLTKHKREFIKVPKFGFMNKRLFFRATTLACIWIKKAVASRPEKSLLLKVISELESIRSNKSETIKFKRDYYSELKANSRKNWKR